MRTLPALARLLLAHTACGSVDTEQCVPEDYGGSGTCTQSMLQAHMGRQHVASIAVDPGALDRTSSFTEQKGQDQGRHKLLLVLVRTGGPDSGARVQSLKHTWVQDLEQDSLVLLQPDAQCKAAYGDNHWYGLTCLEAKAHLSLVDRTDFDWLLVVDDDTYVFAERLRETLRSMDMDKREVYGYPGCGNCGGGRTGFCGGSGYMISRRNLGRMLAPARKMKTPIAKKDKAAFLQHFMSPPDTEWCDVRFACVAQDAGLRPVRVKGLYGWPIEEEGREEEIVELERESPPLVMHYISNSSHMNLIRREFLEEQEHDGGRTNAYDAADWLLQDEQVVLLAASGP